MRRPHREIEFEVPSPPVDLTAGEYYRREVKDTKHGRVTTERRREGDVMVINTQKAIMVDGPLGEEQHESNKTIRLPAIIDFKVLLDAVAVEEDCHTSPPWDDCDGWEHDLEDYNADRFNGNLDAFKKTRGYLSIDRSRYKYERVVVTDESFCGDSRANRFEYFRRKGAAKQVAHELVAAQDRGYIDQIVEWYGHYQEVGVSLEIEIGGKTYESSCHGFEEEYGRDEGRTEVASAVIYDLAKDGFTVVGYDRHVQYDANRTWHKKEQLRRNLHLFDWTA